MHKRAPNDIDRLIAQRLQHYRRISGLSLSDTAEQLGVSRHQFWKYEAQENRIAASRLYEVSQIFQCGIEAFFEQTNSSQQGERTKQAVTLYGHRSLLLATTLIRNLSIA